jgi:hypothetical protein
LETVTQGIARATSHRVLAPAAGTSPRYSIPFFQNIARDLRLSEHVLQCMSFPPRPPLHPPQNLFSFHGTRHADVVPPEVLELKERRGQPGQTDCESPIALMIADRFDLCSDKLLRV